MAGLKRTLEASSLMEVVVAMVIISIVSTLTLLIYLNVMRSMSIGYRYHMESAASYYLDSYEMLPDEKKESFTDENGFYVVFDNQVTAYEYLNEVTLTLTDSLETYEVTKRRLWYQKE
ncbi:MAG: hypothetical protein WBA74_24060 [Cyclobacteriaceae bacterium]